MKTKNFFLAYLVVAVLILQNSFSQTKQTQSQSGRAISLIPKFELKLNEKGMPGALSGKSAMCEISSVVYEPKGPLEPNSFFLRNGNLQGDWLKYIYTGGTRIWVTGPRVGSSRDYARHYPTKNPYNGETIYVIAEDFLPIKAD